MKYHEYKKIPNKLRKCRIARGIKPELAAEILGFKRTSKISSWETGATMPTLVNAFKLAGLYHVMVDELFFDLMHETRKEITAKANVVYSRRGLEAHGQPTQGETPKPFGETPVDK